MPEFRTYLVQKHKREIMYGDMELRSGRVEKVEEKPWGILVYFNEYHEDQTWGESLKGQIEIPDIKNKDKHLHFGSGNEINILRTKEPNHIDVYISSFMIMSYDVDVTAERRKGPR